MSCTTKSIASRCLVFVARALTLFLFAMSVGCGGSSYGVSARGGLCSRECTDDSECTGGARSLVCGVGPSGAGLCVSPCGALSTGYVCENGRPVSCARATDASCSACGCTNEPGTYCDYATDACTPLAEVGAACTTNTECESDNCSALMHVCRVPMGASCNATNCDLCRTRTNGTSYCSGECTDGASDCEGGECVGFSSVNLYHCAATCSPTDTTACPGQCEAFSNSSGYYCACSSPGCSATIAQGDLGDLCRSTAGCESGNCWSAVEVSSFSTRKSIGFCTETCANNADCGSGFACVNAACNGVTCSPICVPSCTTDTDCRRGTCRDITNASTGGSSSVCDIRRANGTTCTWDGDCQSANCNQFGNCE